MKKRIAFAFVLFLVMLLWSGVCFSSNAILAFEEPEYNVFIKKYINLSPVKQNIESNLTYSWESSDPEIATVSGGKVTGVSVGDTTIKCTGKSKKGDEYVASCIVHVSIPVKSISANETEVVLASSAFVWGETPFSEFTPELTILPDDATNKDIIWKTSDRLVAGVDETGKITGLTTGKATVTGEAADGSGAKVSIKVTVPNLLFTTEDIVIDSTDGFIFGYQLNVNGISTFGKSDDVFDTESMDEKYGLEWLRIVPKKAGVGYLVFTMNGSQKKIKVTVTHEAVFDEVSYPVGSMNTEVGKKASYTGDVVLAMDEGWSVIKISSKEYVFFSSEDISRIKMGNNLTLYGEVTGYKTYKTETGLEYECPILEIKKIWKNQ